LGSRRACEQFVLAGKVTINSREITSLSELVDESADVVAVDGKPVALPSKFSYVLLHKPSGSVTTRSDELGRKTVLDLFPPELHLFPIGRLDKNTTGVLLLTNDGNFAQRLAHPKFAMDKVYHITIHRPAQDKEIRKLKSGIMLEDGQTRPCQARALDRTHKKLELILHEGRKRQVRRMVEALGLRVIRLSRVKFSFLTLDGLKPGEWRYLTEREIERLKAGGR
jgi:pseudouridine synthase